MDIHLADETYFFMHFNEICKFFAHFFGGEIIQGKKHCIFSFYQIKHFILFIFLDPDIAQSRLEQMERSRIRLQEQHDAEAARFAEKQRIVCTYIR